MTTTQTPTPTPAQTTNPAHARIVEATITHTTQALGKLPSDCYCWLLGHRPYTDEDTDDPIEQWKTRNKTTMADHPYSWLWECFKATQPTLLLRISNELDSEITAALTRLDRLAKLNLQTEMPSMKSVLCSAKN